MQCQNHSHNNRVVLIWYGVSIFSGLGSQEGYFNTTHNHFFNFILDLTYPSLNQNHSLDLVCHPWFSTERLYFYQQQIEERQFLGCNENNLKSIYPSEHKSYDIPLPDSGYQTERSQDSMRKVGMTSLSVDGDNPSLNSKQRLQLHVSSCRLAELFYIFVFSFLKWLWGVGEMWHFAYRNLHIP